MKRKPKRPPRDPSQPTDAALIRGLVDALPSEQRTPLVIRQQMLELYDRNVSRQLVEYALKDPDARKTGNPKGRPSKTGTFLPHVRALIAAWERALNKKIAIQITEGMRNELWVLKALLDQRDKEHGSKYDNTRY